MGQVVDIAQPADRCVTGIILEGSWVGEAHTRTLMGELRRHGAFATEAASPALLVATWGEGMTPVQVEEAVEQAAGAARDDDVLVSLAFCIPPTDRTREVLQAEVDFTLCTKPRVPETTTTYWAADDPYWATNGLAEPGFRAYVQNLAGQHRGVARALERGQQDKVSSSSCASPPRTRRRCRRWRSRCSTRNEGLGRAVAHSDQGAATGTSSSRSLR
jgi:hypothetical protein